MSSVTDKKSTKVLAVHLSCRPTYQYVVALFFQDMLNTCGFHVVNKSEAICHFVYRLLWSLVLKASENSSFTLVVTYMSLNMMIYFVMSDKRVWDLLF